MTMETLLLVVLIIICIGALPTWRYSSSWGYTPMGALSLLLVVYLVWMVAEGRPLFERSSSGNIESTIQDAGQGIKEAGRDVADSIRDTVN